MRKEFCVHFTFPLPFTTVLRICFFTTWYILCAHVNIFDIIKYLTVNVTYPLYVE
jgi:hypothetical protein